MEAVLASFAHRIGSMEELLRRSETSFGHVLGRLKDVEVAVTHLSRTSERHPSEMAAAMDEISQTKRRVDAVDSTWRQSLAELSAAVQAEFRARVPQQAATEMQTRSEMHAARHDISELLQQQRRQADALSAEVAESRQAVAANKWAIEQLAVHSTQQQREVAAACSRRVEELATDVERSATAIRQTMEQAMRAAHGDLVARVEAESHARDALQADAQVAIAKLRDDVVMGLAHSAAAAKILEENSSSLETVLRAEVRARMQVTEELATHVDTLLRHDSNGREVRTKAPAAAAVAAAATATGSGAGAAADVAAVRHHLDRIADEQRRQVAAQQRIQEEQQKLHEAVALVTAVAATLQRASTPPSSQAQGLASQSSATVAPGFADRHARDLDALRGDVAKCATKRELSALREELTDAARESARVLAVRLDGDQRTIEEHLRKLREEISVAVATAEEAERRSRASPDKASRSSSRSRKSRSRSSSSSSSGSARGQAPPARQESNVDVRLQKPPRENPNRMKEL